MHTKSSFFIFLAIALLFLLLTPNLGQTRTAMDHDGNPNLGRRSSDATWSGPVLSSTSLEGRYPWQEVEYQGAQPEFCGAHGFFLLSC